MGNRFLKFFALFAAAFAPAFAGLAAESNWARGELEKARAADAAATAAVGRPGTRPPLMRPAAAKRRKRPPCGCRWP